MELQGSRTVPPDVEPPLGIPLMHLPRLMFPKPFNVISFIFFFFSFLFYSWWKITDHLGKSILDLSDGLDFFGPPDSLSKHLAYVLFGFYLVMGLIFLINMLIALLSNTYQRVQVRLFVCVFYHFFYTIYRCFVNP